MKFWCDLYKQLSDGEFSKGFVIGAAVVLSAMLIMWIFNMGWSICRSKKCHELKIAGNDGALSVAESAVIALVKLLGGEFRELTIKKVGLFRASNGYRLDIQCGFTLSQNVEPLSELAPLFKQRIREGLCSSLGFSGQLEINLKMVAVNGAPPPASVAKPEKNDNDAALTY